jgi:hypothetical protein
MQKETTAEAPRSKTLGYLRSKLEAISNSSAPVPDPYDLDRFVTRTPTRFYDSYLDSPPSSASVAALVEAGVPRWSLINRGIVNEVFDLLRARRERGLASVRQARYLHALGHACPWSVLFTDVSGELRRLKEGRRL